MKSTLGKAMVFEKVNSSFSTATVTLPMPQPGEVLVEISYTTICKSDLHTYFGRRGGPKPCILGHEIIGRIAALAQQPIHDYAGNSLQTGDRITWSVYAQGGESKMAKIGIPQKSPDLYKYGHEPFINNRSLNGGFATHCLLRKGTAIFKLPTEITDNEASPLNCTHATIAGSLRLAGDVKNKSVLVSGAGMLGLSACAMSRENGAGRVYVTDISRVRLEHALAFGASRGFTADQLTADKIRKKIESEGGIDLVIETSGVPAAMENGIDLLNIGGTSIWVGAVYAQRDLSINAEKIVRKILTIRGLHNYIPTDLATAIQFMNKAHQKYPFHNLVSKTYLLEQLDEAFMVADNEDYYRVGISPTKKQNQ